MAFKRYYYLISSLPLLRLGEAVPFSSTDFLDMCRAVLSEARFRQLKKISLTPEGNPATDVHAAWQSWEGYLRNYLAHERAARRGVAAVEWLRPETDAFPSSRSEFDDALSARTPKERERALDECRWRKLDDLAVMHDFDFDALLIYRLKLLLAEKWVGKDPDEGMEVLAMLVDTAVSQAEQKREMTR